MKDSNSMIAGYVFTDCIGTPGLLSAAEFNKIIEDGTTIIHDRDATARIVTHYTNQ
jgi:chitinase